eukprot:m51a1_g10218 hypothetical protein (602) ;mRNA; f:113803-116834
MRSPVAMPARVRTEGASKGERPQVRLRLDHVLGYRGRDCRDNLKCVASGDFVYFTACVAVQTARASGSQRILSAHTGNISAIAVHPGGELVAPGQASDEATILVWDSFRSEVASTLSGPHTRGVVALCFADAGRLLVSVGAEQDPVVAVWDWKASRLAASAAAGHHKVYAVAAGRREGSVAFATVGAHAHVRAWTLVDSGELVGESAGTAELADACVMCAAYAAPTTLVAGTSRGDLAVFEGSNCAALVRAHKGIVFAVTMFAETTVVSGGEDGLVLLWRWNAATSALSVTKTINATSISPKPSIRSLFARGSELLFGTGTNDICEVKDMVQVRVKHRFHYSDVSSVATHPKLPVLLTVSYDHTLRTWSLKTREAEGVFQLDDRPSAVAYSTDGQRVAIGFLSGGILLLAAEGMAALAARKDRAKRITVLRFAPDGSKLAVGSEESEIDGHTGTVGQIDWSVDSAYMQSYSDAYELLFWQASGQPVGDAALMAEVEWSAWTCVLGWPVSALWRGLQKKGHYVCSVALSPDRSVVAAGLSSGAVLLHRYPALLSDEPVGFVYGGHGSAVTSLAFSADGSSLVSSAASDMSVFIWRVLKRKPA